MAASTGTGTSSHHTSGCRPASTNGTVAAATIRPVARLTTTAITKAAADRRRGTS